MQGRWQGCCLAVSPFLDFLPRPDMFLSANDGKLRKVLKTVATLDSSVPAELLILQSALSAKVLELGDNKLQALGCEVFF